MRDAVLWVLWNLFLAAIPVALLDDVIERLMRAAEANATVARYAGVDAARFAEVGA